MVMIRTKHTDKFKREVGEKILGELGSGISANMFQLSQFTGLPIWQVQAGLAELESQGKVQSFSQHSRDVFLTYKLPTRNYPPGVY